MRISRIYIENFRNFHKLDIAVGQSVVIIGENQIGKTNLLFALRLILDPALPDSARQLRIEDFWDGVSRPLNKSVRIQISIDISDFEDDEGHLAILAEHLIQPDPMVARLTYEFSPLPNLDHVPAKDDDFEFSIYGGDRPENRIGYDLRKRMPIEVFHALRDVEGDLARWMKSPLKPLLDRAKANLERTELQELADRLSRENDNIANLAPINELARNINSKIIDLAGTSQAVETALGFSPADPDKLLRGLRLLLDGKNRDISEASLGTANILYLILRNLELDSLIGDGSRDHTFLGIEEPEAHLHPHIQRLVYRNYLKLRQPVNKDHGNNTVRAVTYLLTTHSTQIASVAPIKSIILLRKDTQENATVGVSGANISLTDAERDDIERYLDVSRAEGLFSRGIILVEGDAEKFLVPLLAAQAGYDLDSLGVTVCSVGGTNFTPYVKFFGRQGLNIPFSIITDLDSRNGDNIHYGIKRAHSLCPLIDLNKALPQEFQEKDFYEDFGIFLNNSTLEIELNNSGCIILMNSVMQATCDVIAAKKRFQELANRMQNEGKVFPIDDTREFLRDIEYVGKGRFAQRLCYELCKCNGEHDMCPPYIFKAIQYVLKSINSKIPERCTGTTV